MDVNGFIPRGGEVISTGPKGAATLMLERGFKEGLGRPLGRGTLGWIDPVDTGTCEFPVSGRALGSVLSLW